MNIFSKLFGKYRKNSKTIAKERLRLVLIHDRSGIPPELLNIMKNEIIAVISKHVKVDRDGIEINLSHSEGRTRLVADIPIISARQSPATDLGKRALR
jgi:cell division topological specificity factor